MAFWEDIRSTVSNTVNKAAQKTENFADITKKKIDLKSEEDKIDELYSKVGKLIYAQVRAGEENKTAIENLFSEIDVKKEKIDQLRDEIAKYKKSKICVHCGTEMPTDSVFCSKCGQKQD